MDADLAAVAVGGLSFLFSYSSAAVTMALIQLPAAALAVA